jgi:hypothetical protein
MHFGHAEDDAMAAAAAGRRVAPRHETRCRYTAGILEILCGARC